MVIKTDGKQSKTLSISFSVIDFLLYCRLCCCWVWMCTKKSRDIDISASFLGFLGVAQTFFLNVQMKPEAQGQVVGSTLQPFSWSAHLEDKWEYIYVFQRIVALQYFSGEPDLTLAGVHWAVCVQPRGSHGCDRWRQSKPTRGRNK